MLLLCHESSWSLKLTFGFPVLVRRSPAEHVAGMSINLADALLVIATPRDHQFPS